MELITRRLQSVSESFLDCVDCVISAAEFLQGRLQGREMVDLILQNMDPGLTTHFVSFQDAGILVSVA